MRQLSRPLFRVAVIYCKGVFYHEHAHYGFCKAIKKLSRGRILLEDHVAISLSSSSMVRLAKKAIGSQPDMIVSVGRLASHQVIEYQTEKKTVIPLVCIGADDLEESLTAHMRPLTAGIVTKVDNPLLPAQLLLYLKKDVSRVVLPYKSRSIVPSIRNSISLIEDFLRSRGVEPIPLSLNKIDELFAKIGGVSSAIVSAVLSVEAAGLDSHQAEVSAYCKKNRVVFFATALDAIDYGAVCALGVDPAEGGRAAAAHVVQSLFKGEAFSHSQEIVLKDVRRFLISDKALKEHGFNLSKAMSYMLEFGGIGIGEEGKVR